MALCIPDKVLQRLYENSEARLFERLRREVSGDYGLLHSLNFPGKRAGSDVESILIDIVKTSTPPPKEHLWRSLFKRKPVSSLRIPV